MTKELVEVKLKLTQQQTHNTKYVCDITIEVHRSHNTHTHTHTHTHHRVENELGGKVHELEEELEKLVSFLRVLCIHTLTLYLIVVVNRAVIHIHVHVQCTNCYNTSEGDIVRVIIFQDEGREGAAGNGLS